MKQYLIRIENGRTAECTTISGDCPPVRKARAKLGKARLHCKARLRAYMGYADVRQRI